MADDAVPDADAAPEAAAATPAKRDWGRYWRTRIVGGIVGLLVLLGLGAVLLDSPIGHRFITDSLASYAPASGLRIEVGRIEGSVLDEATLHDVVLKDKQGTFLTIPVVELKWSPFKWFTTGLDVEWLIARRGHLLRLPELEPGDPDAPLLPDFDIRIARLEIESLLIDEAVAGIGRRIDVRASADIADGRAKLNLASNLGGEDRLMLDLDASEVENIFDLEFDYRAPAGGLLAGMVGSEEDLRATITGDGTWANWRGAALVKSGGERFAAFRLTKAPEAYRILGQVYPDDMLSGVPAQAVGRALSVRFAGNLEDSELSGEIDLVGAAFRASGEGLIDLADNAFSDFAVTARLTDPDLFGDAFSARGLVARVTLDGAFRDLAARYDVSASRLASGEAVLTGLRGEGTARWVDGRLTLPLDLTARRIESGNAMLDPRLAGARLAGTIVYADGALDSRALRLDAPGLRAELALDGDVAAGTYRFTGPVVANGLAFEGLGRADARARIDALIGGPRGWSLDASLDGRLTRVDNDTLKNLAGQPIRFNAQVTLASGAPILVRSARLVSSELTLTVSGERALDGTVRLSGKGRHARYGPFAVDGTIDGAGPNVELVLDSPLPAAGVRDVRLSIAPGDDGFRVDTQGQSLLGPFGGAVFLTTDDDGTSRVRLEDFAISDTAVAGELVLRDGGADGTLALDGGGVSGSLTLRPEAAGQGIDGNIVLRDARFAGAPPISVRAARIRIDGTLGETPDVDFAMNSQGIQRGSLFIGRLSGEGRYADGTGRFEAQLAGRRGSRFVLRTVGTIAPDRISVAARGSYAGRPIDMPQRAVLTKQANGWRLERSQIDFAGGRIQAEGQFGDTSQFTVRVVDMPLSVADVAMGELGLGGTISGVVEFADRPGQLATGKARLLLDDFTRSGLVLTSRPMDLAIIAQLYPDEFEFRAVMREDGARNGRVQAQITGLPASGTLFERLRAGALFGQARYAGPADALWRLTGIEYFDLTGPVELAGDVNGTLDAPVVRGSLKADDMRMQSTLTGTDVTGISALGSFDGSVLRLARFSGTAANGGAVSGSGRIDLSDVATDGVDMDIRIAARNALLLDRDDLKAAVTGPLRIVAENNVGTIAGRLDLVRGNWALSSAEATAALPDIETIERNLPADRQERVRATPPWRYLIDVSANNRFNVKGMGLDSEWAADVRIRGNTAAPRLLGEASLVRGGYEFAGKRFELERGDIRFSGEDPPNPRLDIVAVADINDINARIAIAGTSAAPRISFTSVPALPEEEVLSRLLFGESVSDISAPEALQLGAALASMQSGGGGGGFDPINSLRSAIGVDRLRVVGADETLGRGTSIAVGEYLGRDFYVELVTDGQGYSATQLEYRVTGWLALLATVSSLGTNSVSAEVSKDY